MGDTYRPTVRHLSRLRSDPTAGHASTEHAESDGYIIRDIWKALLGEYLDAEVTARVRGHHGPVDFQR